MEMNPNNTDMEQILRLAIEQGASDIFAVAGLPLTFKIKGNQLRLSETGVLTPQRTQAFAREMRMGQNGEAWSAAWIFQPL